MGVFEEKYFVFVTSAGRTGTKYFGNLLGQMIAESFSVHEPDVIMDFKIKSMRQVRQFGLYQLVFGKLMGKTGIRNLSQRYLSKKIDLERLKTAIIDHRRKYYDSIQQELIIESYSGWYGVIPGIQSLYKNYKVVVIIRDPRDWVTSNMNWGTMYGKRDWVSKLKLGRLSPELIGDDEYETRWQAFSRFQKLCWAWKTIYETTIRGAGTNPNVGFFKFEDLFKSKNRYTRLRDLLAYITQFADKTFEFNIPEGILENRIHKNVSYEFPKWQNWDREMQSELQRICGGLSRKFNY
jgi:hypothetical protein